MFQSIERFRKNLELQYGSIHSIGNKVQKNEYDKESIEENDGTIMDRSVDVVEYPSKNGNTFLFKSSPVSYPLLMKQHDNIEPDHRLPFHSEEGDDDDDDEDRSQPGADGYYRDTGSYTNRFLPPPIMELEINTNNGIATNVISDGGTHNQVNIEYRSTIIDEMRDQCSGGENDNIRHRNVNFNMDDSRKDYSNYCYSGIQDDELKPLGVVINASLVDDYYFDDIIDDLPVMDKRSVVSSSSYASSNPYTKGLGMMNERKNINRSIDRSDYSDDSVNYVINTYNKKSKFLTDDNTSATDGIKQGTTAVALPTSLIIARKKQPVLESDFEVSNYYIPTKDNEGGNLQSPMMRLRGNDHHSYSSSSSIIRDIDTPVFNRNRDAYTPDFAREAFASAANNRFTENLHRMRQFHNYARPSSKVGDSTSSVGVVVGSSYFGLKSPIINMINSSKDIGSIAHGGVGNDSGDTVSIPPSSTGPYEKTPIPTLIVNQTTRNKEPHPSTSSTTSLPSSNVLRGFENYHNNQAGSNDIKKMNVPSNTYHQSKFPPTFIVKHNYSSTPQNIHPQVASSAVSLPSTTLLRDNENHHHYPFDKPMAGEGDRNDKVLIRKDCSTELSGKVFDGTNNNKDTNPNKSTRHDHPPVVVVPVLLNDSNNHYKHSNDGPAPNKEALNVTIPETINISSNTLVPSRIIVPGKDVIQHSPFNTTERKMSAYVTGQGHHFNHTRSPKERRKNTDRTGDRRVQSSPLARSDPNVFADKVNGTGDAELDTVVSQIMKLQPNQALKLKEFLSLAEDTNKNEKHLRDENIQLISSSLHPAQILKLEKISKQNIIQSILNEKSAAVNQVKSFQSDETQILPPLRSKTNQHHQHQDHMSKAEASFDADYQDIGKQDCQSIPKTVPMAGDAVHSNKNDDPVDVEDHVSILINHVRSMITQASLPVDDNRSRARTDPPTHRAEGQDNLTRTHNDQESNQDFLMVVQSLLGEIETSSLKHRDDTKAANKHEQATGSLGTNSDTAFIPKDDTGIIETEESGTINKDDTGVLDSKESTTSWKKSECFGSGGFNDSPNDAVNEIWSNSADNEAIVDNNIEATVDAIGQSSLSVHNSGGEASLSKSERKSVCRSSPMSVSITIVPLDTTIVNELIGEATSTDATSPKNHLKYKPVVDEEFTTSTNDKSAKDFAPDATGSLIEPPQSISTPQINSPNTNIPEVRVKLDESYPTLGELPIVLAHSILEDVLSDSSSPRHLAQNRYGDEMRTSIQEPNQNAAEIAHLHAEWQKHKRKILKVVGIPVHRTLDALSEHSSLNDTFDQQRFNSKSSPSDVGYANGDTVGTPDNENNIKDRLSELQDQLKTTTKVSHGNNPANYLTVEFSKSQLSPRQAVAHDLRKHGLDPIATKVLSSATLFATPKSRRTYTNKGAPQEDVLKSNEKSTNEDINQQETLQKSSLHDPRKSQEQEIVMYKQTREPPSGSPQSVNPAVNTRNNGSTEQVLLVSQNESRFMSETASTSLESLPPKDPPTDPLFRTTLSVADQTSEKQQDNDVDCLDRKTIPSHMQGVMNPAEAQKLAKEALVRSNAKDALRDLRHRASSLSSRSISRSSSIRSRRSQVDAHQDASLSRKVASQSIKSCESNAPTHNERKQLSTQEFDNLSYQRRQFLSSYSSESASASLARVKHETSKAQRHLDGSVGSSLQPTARSSKASSGRYKSIGSRRFSKDSYSALSVHDDDDSGTIISYKTAPLPSTRYARFHDLVSRRDITLTDPPADGHAVKSNESATPRNKGKHIAQGNHDRDATKERTINVRKDPIDNQSQQIVSESSKDAVEVVLAS